MDAKLYAKCRSHNIFNVEKDGVIVLFTYNLLLNILKFPFQADFFLRSFNKNQTKFSVCHGHTNF